VRRADVGGEQARGAGGVLQPEAQGGLRAVDAGVIGLGRDDHLGDEGAHAVGQGDDLGRVAEVHGAQ